MTLDPQVQNFLEQLATIEQPPIDEQTPEQVRHGLRALSALSGPGEDVAAVEDRTAPGPTGDVPVRVYRPSDDDGDGDGDGLAPVLVWFHGGGFVIGDLETTDSTCRGLAAGSGVTVVSVDYRLAPEHPFPAGFDDCLAVTRWVADHGTDIGVDDNRMAVGGDSAGGNLAALVAVAARDHGGPPLRFQLLVYPATDLTMSHPSIRENGEGKLLTADTMRWFTDHYLGDHDRTDPSVSPLHVKDLAGLPPAMVITAGHDPLRDEGDAYAELLSQAGVAVDHVRYDGMIHAFFGMDALFDTAKEAMERASEALREGLSGQG
ncbi:alpha/beta hydrolase [soil metagenome]